MEGIQDRALRGEKTSSEKNRERKSDRRAKMSDAEKLAKWEEKHREDCGIRQIPADILELPCGCKRELSSDFRLTRASPNGPWLHVKCQVNFHPSFVRRFAETESLSHFAGTEEELLNRIESCLTKGAAKNGNLTGSLVLEIPADDVYSRIGRQRTLQGVVKPPAARAEVVAYLPQALKQAGEKEVKPGLTIVAIHGWPGNA